MIIFLALLITQFANFEYRATPGFTTLPQDSAHSFDVLHYLINVDLPMSSRDISGCVTIACRSNQNNLQQLDLQLGGLNVDSIRVDGVPAAYSHTGDTILINLPFAYNLGDSFGIKVGYRGTATGELGYLWYSSLHNIAYSLGCPYSTKRWMPCYDNMIDKADNGCEIFVTVPDSYTVCATGRYLGRTVNSGRATYHWKHDRPISPYLIHFASSIFSTYTDWYVPASGDSVEVMYYFWPGDSGYARQAFNLTTDMLACYDSLFGPYPFERYGMDVLYPFYYGGMEHQTTASIIRSWITSGPDYYGMAHEMSHMWWGDMVTCFGWRNVWINEGFGTYCDALYRERREGHTAFLNTMTTRRANYLSAEDANPHSVYDPPENLLYEWGHSYCKGSWILHMIRYLCGNDETWLGYMAEIRDSFAYQNASTADLNRLLNRRLAGNYDWFFQEWVYGYGYPRYRVAWNKVYESPSWRLILDVSQTQTVGPPVFHMPLPISANYSSGDTDLVLTIDQSPQHFEYVLSREPIGITVDPDKWVIQRNTVVGINEENQDQEPNMPAKTSATVCRWFQVRLTDAQLIRVFDVSGRELKRATSRNFEFAPERAGVYYLQVGETIRKLVIIK